MEFLGRDEVVGKERTKDEGDASVLSPRRRRAEGFLVLLVELGMRYTGLRLQKYGETLKQICLRSELEEAERGTV